MFFNFLITLLEFIVFLIFKLLIVFNIFPNLKSKIMKKKTNILFIVIYFIIIQTIKTDCLNNEQLNSFGFQEIHLPSKTESIYCHKIWETDNFCLQSENSFKTIIESNFKTSTSLRQNNFSKIMSNFNLLISKIESDKEKILDKKSRMLYPLNLTVFKFKFEKTYPSCYTEINGNISNILCKLVSQNASNLISDKNKIKLNREYNYAMLKNCLHVLRGFCLYFKYFYFKALEEKKENEFFNIIDIKVIEACDSNLVICSNDYSNVECTDEVRDNLFINFLNEKGIFGEEFIQEMIGYYFEGKNFPENKKEVLGFVFDEEQKGIELFLNYDEIKYEYKNLAIFLKTFLIYFSFFL